MISSGGEPAEGRWGARTWATEAANSSGCSVEVEESAGEQLVLDASPVRRMRMVASGARGARPERKTPASVLSASASVATVGKSREHEWAARARTHRVERVAPCLWHRRLPPPRRRHVARREERLAHAHLAPQRRRASRRRPVATGRRAQACTSEGRHLVRQPAMCSRRQACGSGQRHTDCGVRPSAIIAQLKGVLTRGFLFFLLPSSFPK